MNTPDPSTSSIHRPIREPPPASQLLRCNQCGEVIGVYEPLVRLLDGRAHASSRALEPASSDRGGEHYHRACYERLGEERQLAG
jgi:hypothetical protein